LRKKIVVAAVLALAAGAPAAEARTLTFTPTDDARVEQTNPNTNYKGYNLKASSNGSCSTSTPCMHSYLLFDVKLGANEQVGSASLKLTPASSSYAGVQTYGGDSDSWDEHSITWAHWSRPGVAGTGGTSGSTSCTTNDCVSVNVSNLVNWNGNLTTIILKSSVYFEALSQEDGAAVAPKLVVETVPYSDTSAPTAPGAWPGSHDATQTSAQISWSASTDNVRVAGYNIYLNGVLHEIVNGSGSMMEETITGLTCDTSYTATLRAFDPSGNLSGVSNDVAVQTNECGVHLRARFTGTNGHTWIHEDDFWANLDGEDGATKNPNWFAESGEVEIDNDTGKVREDYFRMWTRRTDFGDVKVTHDLRVNELPNLRGDTAGWDGVKLWLRRRLCTPEPGCGRVNDANNPAGYTVEYALRSSQIYIQKRSDACPGGYAIIGTGSNVSIPLGTWRNVGGTVENGADGSVTIQVLINGSVAATATDPAGSQRKCGVDPFTASGRVGLRGDNVDMNIDNLVVRDL
jgi:hypothetical protein